MVSLMTNIPEIFADLCDEIRLFFDVHKIPAVSEVSPEGFCIRHVLREGTSLFHTCTLYREGQEEKTYTYVTKAVPAENKREYKKIRKRGAKIALYRCLSGFFGIAKPWGSLTGIRPTKLLRDSIALMGIDEAKRLFLQEFDVSEEKFSLALAVCESQRETLASALPQHLDIYIGIPFCTSRCSYCSFFSSNTTKDGSTEEAYVRALESEAALLSDMIAKYHVRSVYIGGGTPTALSEALLRRVLLAAGAFKAEEFTVEAGRPDTVTKAKLEMIRFAGAGRISINPQTTCEATLGKIGRNHTVSDFFAAARLAKEMGFDAINMDLIAGLPGEGLSEFRKTLQDVSALAPENITVHSLAIKRASKFGMENVGQFASASEAEAMIDASRAALSEAGYRPYYLYRQKYMAGNMENTGYALPGKECVYNIDIMEETVSVLALGAGAVSKRIFGGESRIERFMGVKDIGNYISRVGEMAGKKRGLFD